MAWLTGSGGRQEGRGLPAEGEERGPGPEGGVCSEIVDSLALTSCIEMQPGPLYTLAVAFPPQKDLSF